jgi:hypothetical protein
MAEAAMLQKQHNAAMQFYSLLVAFVLHKIMNGKKISIIFFHESSLCYCFLSTQNHKAKCCIKIRIQVTGLNRQDLNWPALLT